MAACKYFDPLCPCQDGDMCHYGGRNPISLPPVYATRMADEIERQAQEISRLQGLLTKLQLDGKPNRKQRRSAASR